MLTTKSIYGGLAALAIIAGLSGWAYTMSEPAFNDLYSVEFATEQTTPETMAKPLPDISGYTIDAVREKIQQTHAAAAVKVSLIPDIEDNRFAPYLPVNFLITSEALQTPEYNGSIILESGTVTLSALIQKINDPDYMEETETAFFLKAPLFIAPGAALVIEDQTKPVRLGQEDLAQIVNFGKLFIVNSTLLGWNTSENKPARYKDSGTFRPYLIGVNGSETYLAGSRFSHLGYKFPKSYGITFTTSRLITPNADITSAEKPKGWVIDSAFEDIYYGFYCYEADDIPILRNVYKDNIIYGIDPHDRSNRLIIAYNDSYGAKYKHGIIVSREVNDSWIFNNTSHHNHGAGIMIDRNSRNNVITGNNAYENEGDGLVFFESPDNVASDNEIHNNGKSGIRLRNSWNITLAHNSVRGNKIGLEAYTTALNPETRDLQLDPYEERATVDLVSMKFLDNTTSQISVRDIEEMQSTDMVMLKNPVSIFNGDLKTADAAQLFDTLTTPDLTTRVAARDR